MRPETRKRPNQTPTPRVLTPACLILRPGSTGFAQNKAEAGYRGKRDRWLGVYTHAPPDGRGTCSSYGEFLKRVQPKSQKGTKKKGLSATLHAGDAQNLKPKMRGLYETCQQEMLAVVLHNRKDKRVSTPMPCELACLRKAYDMSAQGTTQSEWCWLKHSCLAEGTLACNQSPCEQMKAQLVRQKDPALTMTEMQTAIDTLVYGEGDGASAIKASFRQRFDITVPPGYKVINVRHVSHPIANPFRPIEGKGAAIVECARAYNEYASNPPVTHEQLSNIAYRNGVTLATGARMDRTKFIYQMQATRLRASLNPHCIQVIQHADEPSEADAILMLIDPNTPQMELPDFLREDRIDALRTAEATRRSAAAASSGDTAGSNGSKATPSGAAQPSSATASGSAATSSSAAEASGGRSPGNATQETDDGFTRVPALPPLGTKRKEPLPSTQATPPQPAGKGRGKPTGKGGGRTNHGRGRGGGRAQERPGPEWAAGNGYAALADTAEGGMNVPGAHVARAPATQPPPAKLARETDMPSTAPAAGPPGQAPQKLPYGLVPPPQPPPRWQAAADDNDLSEAMASALPEEDGMDIEASSFTNEMVEAAIAEAAIAEAAMSGTMSGASLDPAAHHSQGNGEPPPLTAGAGGVEEGEVEEDL